MPLCVSCHGEYRVPSHSEKEYELPAEEGQKVEAPDKSLQDKDQTSSQEGQANETEKKSWQNDMDEQSELVPPSGFESVAQTKEQSSAKQEVSVTSMPGRADNQAQAPGSDDNIGASLSTGENKSGECLEMPPYVCARCQQSNERWHQWIEEGILAHLKRFFVYSIWGVVTIGSFLLPVIAAGIIAFTSNTLDLIAVLLAAFLSFISIILLYTLRDLLWQYDVLRSISRGLRPSLVLLSVIAFILAFIFGLVVAILRVTDVTNLELGQFESLLPIITTVLLALPFVSVSLSAALLAAREYCQWLNHEMPQPIYAQERLLLKVIKDSIKEDIQKATSKDTEVETFIMDLERTPDGGVTLLLTTETIKPPASGEMKLIKLQDWKVTADRWGQIKKMSKEGMSHYLAVESTVTAASGDNDKEKSNSDLITTSGNGLFLQGSYVTGYRSRSDTTISVTSNRKFWKD